MKSYGMDASGQLHDITEAVQIMYDTVVASLDFGSGFLDVIEVARMREAAEVLGFAPMEYSEDVCSVCGHRRAVHSLSLPPDRNCCFKGPMHPALARDMPDCACSLGWSEIVPIPAEQLIEAADRENSENEDWIKRLTKEDED